MLDELTVLGPALELLGAQEVIVAPVALTGPGLARGRRDRQLEAGDALE
jgi:hypothetical protein